MDPVRNVEVHPAGLGPPEMYSTKPLISHLGSECFPLITVFLMRSDLLGASSKLPFGRVLSKGGEGEIKESTEWGATNLTKT